MKRIIYLLVFLTALGGCNKQPRNEQVADGGATKNADETGLIAVTDIGVIFYANNVDKAFERAKAMSKPVFLEIYSETCHVCQTFIPVFKESQVSDFYNKNFFNYRIEVNSPEFQSFVLANKLFIPSLPTLLYFDQNRKITHLASIEADGNALVEQGKMALDPAKNAASMKTRFEAGEKNSQFLVDYAMFNRVTMDTVMNRKAMEVYAAQQPESAYATETNFLAIQKLLMDVDNPMGVYFINHLPAYRKLREPEEVKRVAENLIMSSLYSSFGNQYSSDKIKQMREYMIKAEIETQVARNRVLLPLINAYFRENTSWKATELVNFHITQVPLKVPDYVYLIRHFNEKCPDASYVPSAEKWVENALNMAQKGGEEEVEIRSELAAAKRRTTI